MTLRCEVSETLIRRTWQNCGVQVWESVKPPRVGLGRGDMGDELREGHRIAVYLTFVVEESGAGILGLTLV